jgi:hypothetical protein
MALAERAGLTRLAGEHVRVPGGAGAFAAAKMLTLVAGMLVGAKSIAGMRLLRHGAMGRVFYGIRAPSTLGTFLRAFTLGHAAQVAAVSARMLIALTALTPGMVPGDRVCYLDIDDTVKRTYGHAKQGVGYGYNGVKGLNVLMATLSSAVSAPVICGALLREGSANSVRGAGAFVTRAINLAHAVGAGGTPARLIVRADSAFYAEAVVTACRRGGAKFSVTMRTSLGMCNAIAAIDETEWTSIKYPRAIWDEEQQRWISEAQVAETTYIAFVGSGLKKQVRGRLIVRRVTRLTPARKKSPGQGELFDLWRYHVIFTDTDAPMLEAEAAHRDHAIIETVHADLRDSFLSHLPSGSFAANTAWLHLAVIAYNLSRAAGHAAGGRHARATTRILREHLIAVPARVTRSARRQHLRMPRNWPWQTGLDNLKHHATTAPPDHAAA